MGEGFPLSSMASMAWEGREPFEIGSVSLSLSVSAFSSAALSPFRVYMEIRNSDWTETFAVIFFYQKLAFLQPKKGINRFTSGPRGSGARPGGQAPPCLVATWGTVSRGFYFPKIIYIPKKYPPVFIPFGLRLIWIFYETKNMQQT